MRWDKLKKPVRHFDADESGNVAVIGALMIIPILGLVGMALDFQVTTTRKNQVQQLIDSATILGSRSMQDGASKDEVAADIRKYVAAQAASLSSGMTCAAVKIEFSEQNEDIELSMRCTQPTILSTLIGQDEMAFSVNSGSTYSVGEVDIAFVFDVSGSMYDEGRMDSLKSAATIAVDTLLPASSPSTTTSDVRLSMVTYANGVNAGQYFEDVTDISDDEYPVTVKLDEITCTGMSPLGVCATGYYDSRKEISSFRTDSCTFDRTGSKAFTDDKPASGAYLSPAKELVVQMTDDTNLTDNRKMNPSSGFWGSSATRSNGNGWSSTEGEFLFRKSGSYYSSNYWMEVNGDTGRIHQIVDTNTDVTTELVFDFRPNPDDVSNGKMNVYVMPQTVSASASQSTLDQYKVKEIRPSTTTGWNSWQQLHVEFTPTSDKTRILFEHVGSDDEDGPWIDDVWVVESVDRCPSQEPLPLTADRTAINNFIQGMEPFGGTAGHHGIAWGWYLIAPEWKDVWPSDSKPHGYLGSASNATSVATSTKAVIIMTDGEFNVTHAESQGTSTEQAKSYCDKMKEKGVVVFTVAFKAPEEGEEVLEYCASGANRAFQADDEASLKDAYRDIAESISDLRITH